MTVTTLRPADAVQSGDTDPAEQPSGYVLDTNLGFLLRRAQQVNSAIFNQSNESALSTTQFAALHRLVEDGALSQNELGRRVHADGATIKGIVSRLEQRAAVAVRRSESDRRELVIETTEVGVALYRAAVEVSECTSARQLQLLSPGERLLLIELLIRMNAAEERRLGAPEEVLA